MRKADRTTKDESCCVNDVILLDLSTCCIETAAKRAHRQMVDFLANAHESQSQDQLEETKKQIELVLEFLETTDFAKLRSCQPELAGSSSVCVRLYRSETGKIVWDIEENR